MTSKSFPHYVSPDDLFVYPVAHNPENDGHAAFYMGDGVAATAWFLTPNEAADAFDLWNADRLTPAVRGEVEYHGGSSYCVRLFYS